jgi:superfamily II DNA/RNA helicase
MASFDDPSLRSSLRQTLQELGLTEPTEVQQLALPALLDGASAVVVAPTGSGKTLAYGLPLLQRVKQLEEDEGVVPRAGSPRGLVMVPGRELGEQVARELKRFTHQTRLRVRTVLGGVPLRKARSQVEGGVEVLVATPGRLGQLLDGGHVHLDALRMLVFDEVDELLEGGGADVVRRIPSDGTVQRVAVSATLSRRVQERVEALFDAAPTWLEASGVGELVPTLRVVRRPVGPQGRLATLKEVLDDDPVAPTLLFVNTRDQVDEVAAFLEGQGYAFVTYRGELDRTARRVQLRRFLQGEVGLLLATDLGARGLDLPDVERVINVFLPRERERYLHRAGRTARAGEDGLLVDLVADRDDARLATLPQPSGR